MCGIVGIYDLTGLAAGDGRAYLQRMMDRLVHRGPDDEGIWLHPRGHVALGLRRLAMLDLTQAGHQPMTNDSGNLVITFNGEVYSFLEVRKELQRKGHAFRSNSDTEVLLKAYEEWGEASLTQVRGMFAFAIWDEKRQELVLARDRLGEKPLYYAYRSGRFAFASELSALAQIPWLDRTIDQYAVSLYLQYRYIPAPYSIFTGVRKLPPGHIIRVSDRGLQSYPYWEPSREAMIQPLFHGREASDMLEDLLRQSVQEQMVADVPIGSFLSGGIDSSLITALMQDISPRPVQTFTIGFQEKSHDESSHADKVSRFLGTNHTTKYVDNAQALKVAEEMPEMFGEPFADSSAIATYLVSRLAGNHVKAVLTGDGGDELFGGYTRYNTLDRYIPWLRMLDRTGVGRTMIARIGPGKLAHKLNMIGLTPPQIYEGMVRLFDRTAVTALVGRAVSYQRFEAAWDRAWKHGDDYRAAMLTDLLTYLPEDILTKVDRASMRASLETRAPFLDPRVVAFSLAQPSKLVREKALLKNILYRRVPKTMFNRPKQGFAVPMGDWLRGPLRDLLHAYVRPTKLEPMGVENGKLINLMIEEHVRGTRQHGSRLWALLVLGMWGDRKDA